MLETILQMAFQIQSDFSLSGLYYADQELQNFLAMRLLWLTNIRIHYI